MTPREPSLREAAEALRSHPARYALMDGQRQLDQDGIEVGVSRQAVVELLAACWTIIEALSREDVVPEGWVVVPREPTEAMVTAALSALTEWRKGLSADEAILRRSAPIESGRVWLASATPEEKAVIRYRAMIASTPTTHEGA
jgi:hypothetical protein